MRSKRKNLIKKTKTSVAYSEEISKISMRLTRSFFKNRIVVVIVVALVFSSASHLLLICRLKEEDKVIVVAVIDDVAIKTSKDVLS